MNEQVERRFTPVAAISKDEQCAVLEDGRICKFTDMYDVDGLETDDVAEAVTAIAKHPEGAWIVLHFRDFDGVTIH